MQGERQRDDPRSPDATGGPARHPGPCAAAADEERTSHAGEAYGLRHGHQPRLVELRGRTRDPLAGHPPGLLDPDDGDPGGRQLARQGGEVTGLDPAAGAMAEDEQRTRPPGGRSANSRASPTGVSTDQGLAVTRASGSSRSMPLLSTLLTRVDTG